MLWNKIALLAIVWTCISESQHKRIQVTYLRMGPTYYKLKNIFFTGEGASKDLEHVALNPGRYRDILTGLLKLKVTT
jgi:hypothetical protein